MLKDKIENGNADTKMEVDRLRIVIGIIVMGSMWGLLECTLGGIDASIVSVDVSSGAVLAGFFGLGFMALAWRIFSVRGAALGMAVVAGIMRYFAPVGSFVLCSAIAIVAEGAIFEMIMSRPSFNQGSLTMKDPRGLSFLGIIVGYTIFVSGYIITQILTPVVGSDSGSVLDVVAALPIILGSGFFAALLGGLSLPLVILAPQLEIDVAKVKKEIFYTISSGVSAFCWIMLVLIFHVNVF